MDKIAVVVPVYNVQQYLNRCVDSLLKQTITNYTVYLIDDGSTDRSAEICEQYSNNNANVTTIHQTNEGLSGARNTGIKAALDAEEFTWITFVDSDDWVDENYLSYLIKANQKNDTRISVCSYTREAENSYTVKKNSVWVIDSDSLVAKYPIEGTVAWGKLYDIKLFDNMEYPVGKLHEDEFVTYKLLDACRDISFVELPLYFYFLNPAGIMKSGWNKRKLDSIEAFEEQKDYYKKTNNWRMYGYAVNKYNTGLALQLQNIASSNLESSEKINLEKRLQKKLRKSLLMNSAKTPMITQNMWIYETAYPSFMKMVYWPYKKAAHGAEKAFSRLTANNKANKFFRKLINASNRKRLNNTGFSLLASNCTGGFILHDLGLQFNSPFINLWITPADFIKYLNDMDYYNSCSLHFIESDKKYPVGQLDDITIYFQHYKSNKDAEDSWNRRKERINKDNIFVIMTDRDGCTYQNLVDFDKLPFEKVVFTHKYYPQIQSAVFVKGFQDSDMVGNLFEYKSLFSGKKYYDELNYIDWFNNRKS